MSGGPRRIVVGYDGSDRARAALDVVRNTAAPGAEVTVVYAHRIPPEMRSYEFFQDLLEEVERGAREIVGTARAALEGSGLEVRCEAREGGAAEVIADIARREHADMIVMASRGLGRVRAAIGSTVLELLQDAPCPVLVVPAR